MPVQSRHSVRSSAAGSASYAASVVSSPQSPRPIAYALDQIQA